MKNYRKHHWVAYFYLKIWESKSPFQKWQVRKTKLIPFEVKDISRCLRMLPKAELKILKAKSINAWWCQGNVSYFNNLTFLIRNMFGFFLPLTEELTINHLATLAIPLWHLIALESPLTEVWTKQTHSQQLWERDKVKRNMVITLATLVVKDITGN